MTSGDKKQITKLVEQKQALGLYLDSLLGVTVFEKEEDDDSDSISQIEDKSDIDLSKDDANIDNSVEKNSSDKLIEENEQPETFLNAKEDSSEITAKVDNPMATEPLIDTGSLSVKYLSSLNGTESKEKNVPPDKPEKDKETVSTDIKIDTAEIDKEDENEQGFVSTSNDQSLNEPTVDNGIGPQTTPEVSDNHDIYRQKLLDRQKQIAQRKEERKQQRLIQKQQQSSKISLSAIDQEGIENKQVLIPRSQFLKNKQNNEQAGTALENSSRVISLQEKKLARESIQQETSSKKTTQNSVDLGEFKESIEYAQAANAKMLSDTTVSKAFSESELIDNIASEKKQPSSESAEGHDLNEKHPTRQAVTEKTSDEGNSSNGSSLTDSSISAFSRFAEQNKQSVDMDNKQKNLLHEQQSKKDTAEKQSIKPQAQLQNKDKNENNHQLSDAPDLDLSLFLPKVPSLAEIEAIEQKERLLKAQQFVPDTSKQITTEVTEETIIQTGVSISTSLVSPHTQKQKSLAPNWAKPSFQAMFFDVAGLKLAIPLLELHGIVEWGKDYITPMPGHEKWYLGLLQYRGKSVPIVDTLQQVFPPNQAKRLLKERDQFKNIIMIDDGHWGLACEQIIGIRTIAADEVKWRTDQTKRRWLLGTVKEQMCALLDSKQFAAMLKTGEDSLLPTKNKNITK